jgi:hypothetical protein
VVIGLGEEDALVFDERMEPAIEHATKRGRVDGVMVKRCKQFHVNRDWKFVGDDLTGFVSDGAAIEVDANALTVQEIDLRLCRDTNAAMRPKRRQP